MVIPSVRKRPVCQLATRVMTPTRPFTRSGRRHRLRHSPQRQLGLRYLPPAVRPRPRPIRRKQLEDQGYYTHIQGGTLGFITEKHPRLRYFKSCNLLIDLNDL